ncbi:MAG: LPS export ABC transporter permease LptG [Burkholderiales bacterium]
MKTLRRLLWKEIVSATLLVFAALLMLFAFFDLVGELKEIGRGSYRLPRILAFVLLSLPGHIYDLFPLAALIGTLFALAQMVASSEYTVIRASGVSTRSVAIALARFGFGFALVTFVFGELVAPHAEQWAQRIKTKAVLGVVAQEFFSGVWLRDERNFINVRTVSTDASLSGVRIYEFDADFHLRTVSVAERGEYQQDGSWLLTGVAQTRFVGDRAEGVKLAQASWRSVLDPGMVDMLMVQPEQMSAWNLNQYIQHLRENRQKTVRHEVALWLKLTYPFAVVVMMVLALPFAYFQVRAGGVGVKIFTGIMLGVLFYLFNRVSGHMAIINNGSPIVSAVLPTACFLLVAIVMLWWVERR